MIHDILPVGITSGNLKDSGASCRFSFLQDAPVNLHEPQPAPEHPQKGEVYPQPRNARNSGFCGFPPTVNEP